MNQKNTQDKACLIGVIRPRQKRPEAMDSFEELKSLADTAGAITLHTEFVDLKQISPATFLGKGKVEEIKASLQARSISLVIFDAELSPAQSRNLEKTWGVRVLDRTGLILDIFAFHAKSREGKLQVALAQYQYLYPRLVGAWEHLSKQRGGSVGLRGPGETQLEVDRRRVRERIDKLKADLKKVASSRGLHRRRRQAIPVPTVTLVGYTNAGKSTLFNALAQGDTLVEDKLFATLDPKTKQMKLPSGRVILLTDTVGFIRNLPHQLVEAFKSTFEEARDSDLLLHVVDSSHENFMAQAETVIKVLAELKLDSIPLIWVFNKVDKGLQQTHFPGKKVVPISALTGEGLPGLLHEIDRSLSQDLETFSLFLPHPFGAQLSQLYTQGRVLQTESDDRGIFVRVNLPEKWKKVYKKYFVAY